jgi:hypothetical protein
MGENALAIWRPREGEVDELVGTVAWQDVIVVVVVWASGLEGVALSDFKSAWMEMACRGGET